MRFRQSSFSPRPKSGQWRSGFPYKQLSRFKRSRRAQRRCLVEAVCLVFAAFASFCLQFTADPRRQESSTEKREGAKKMSGEWLRLSVRSLLPLPLLVPSPFLKCFTLVFSPDESWFTNQVVRPVPYALNCFIDCRHVTKRLSIEPALALTTDILLIMSILFKNSAACSTGLSQRGIDQR